VLTEQASQELEFILMYIIKKQSVEAAYTLVHIAGLLLFYLQPSEVFAVCDLLIERSRKIFSSKK